MTITCTETIQDTLKKAQNGDVDAMVTLADAYYYGEGIELDIAKSYAWYLKAVGQSDPKALCLLGYMKRKGIGCERDFSGAFTAFKKSAEKNFPMAMYNLGLCYEEGIGTMQDKELAESWYIKAKASGYSEWQAEDYR